MAFVYCLLSYFSDSADKEHSYLVEIPVKRSIFEFQIIQKRRSKIITIKKICYFLE